MVKIGMCDDHIDTLKLAGKLIESELMEQNFEAEITLITDNQKEVLEAVKTRKVDILFLDIDFKNKGKNGIEFAKELRTLNKDFYLIFLTAFHRYMHVSFTVKVYDYLVKPINRENVEELISRLKEEFRSEKTMFLHLNKWESIRTDNILYIEKQGNKSIVITTEGNISTSKTLEKLLQELPANFHKCHRSYIVNIKKIVRVDRKNNIAFLAKNTTCPINSYFSL